MQILEVLPDHGIDAPGAAQKRTPRKMPQEAFGAFAAPMPLENVLGGF